MLPAAPAAAHSELRSSTPAAGSRVDVAPQAVTLLFDEGVGISAGSLVVLDGAGRRVDDHHLSRPGGNLSGVRVGLVAGLAHGAYTVLWRVVSDDGHPVSGTFSFGVGVPAATAPVQPVAPAATLLLHDLLTLGAYVGALLLVGVTFFGVAVRPGALGAAGPRALLRGGWWLSGVSAVALFLVQGPFDIAGGLLDLRDPALLQQTMTTRPGVLLVVRVFVLGLAAAAGPWPGTEPATALRRNAAGLGVLFVPTFSLAGHSGSGPLAPLAVVSDVAHLTAAGVWLGGLAALLTCLPTLTAAGPAEAAEEAEADGPAVWRRWSGCATVAVVVLALTGTFQAWRQVPAPAALTGTGYGRWLLTKLALVALVLVAAGQARRRVVRARVDARTAARLRRSMVAELSLGLAVVAVTTALVGQAPARQTYHPPFGATLTCRTPDGVPATLVVDVPSTAAGPQTIHVRARTADGAPLAFAQANGTLERQPDGGPIRFALAREGVGSAVARDVAVPSAGTWRLTLHLLTDAFTDCAGTVTYQVR